MKHDHRTSSVTLALRRLLWLFGAVFIGAAWLILAILMMVLSLVEVAWRFVSGHPDFAQSNLGDKLIDVLDGMWTRWNRLLSHNGQDYP